MPKPTPSRTWKRRLTRGFLLFILTPYLAVTIIFTVLQRHFLYPATQANAIHADNANLPNGQIHDLAVTTHDGLELHGWLLLAEGHSAETVDKALASHRPVILYFPGNSGNRQLRLLDLRDFSRLGYNVIIFDYRGYGDNPGQPTEETLITDARTIWNTITDDYDLPPERILLFGESLGGAIATSLAAELSREKTPPAALILNSTFSSMTDVVAAHYPYFPFQFLLLDRYPSEERIAQVACPIVIIHGARDGIVPIPLARKLFAAAPQTSISGIEKQFIKLPTAGHNEIPPQTLKSTLETTPPIPKSQIQATPIGDSAPALYIVRNTRNPSERYNATAARFSTVTSR